MNVVKQTSQVSISHYFWDITTFTVYVTAHDPEKSFSFYTIIPEKSEKFQTAKVTFRSSKITGISATR